MLGLCTNIKGYPFGFFTVIGKDIACPSRMLHLKLYGVFRDLVSPVWGIFGGYPEKTGDFSKNRGG